MKSILAIDPGTTQSAYCHIEDGIPTDDFGLVDNEDMLDHIYLHSSDSILVIEKVESFGMAVGKSVFETCVWAGRFIEAHNIITEKEDSFVQIGRREVKLHLCNSVRAKDSNIRQALIDRFGEPGTKKNPGLLYGFKKDIWSALAVGITYHDSIKK